jgi:hypothetical protein
MIVKPILFALEISQIAPESKKKIWEFKRGQVLQESDLIRTKFLTQTN